MKMSSALPAAAAAFALLAFSACSAPPPAPPSVDVAAIANDIRAFESDWQKDIDSRDPAKVAARFTPDGQQIVSLWKPLIGAPAIQEAWTEWFAIPGFTAKFTPEIVTVARSGELAYVKGAYSVLAPDPKTKKVTETKGNYLTTYAKGDDGTWHATVNLQVDAPAAS